MNKLVLTHEIMSNLLTKSPSTAIYIWAGINRVGDDLELLACANSLSAEKRSSCARVAISYLSNENLDPSQAAARLLAQLKGQAAITAALVLMKLEKSIIVKGWLSGFGDTVVPIEDLQIAASGLPVFQADSKAEILFQTVAPRHSRLVGAIGWQAYEKISSHRFIVLGCGRTGSLMAMSLARLGAKKIILVDPDNLGLHNLDAMDGVFAKDIGRYKADALADSLLEVDPSIEVTSCHLSITAMEVLNLVKKSDFILSCVDDDGARWTANLVATLYLKYFIDVGTGIWLGGNLKDRVMGADVRLLIAGQGCLSCCGGLVRNDHISALRLSYTSEVQSRKNRDWKLQRSGSLRSLNQVSVGLALRLIEDLFAARLSTLPHWLRVTYSPEGLPTIENISVRQNPTCPICALQGLADVGLLHLPK